MKKKISLALSIGVLLTSVPPVQVMAGKEGFVSVSSSSYNMDAKTLKIDVEEYIPRVKSLFQIGDEYSNFNTYSYDRESVELSWHGENGHISVTIDDEGNIVGYYKGDYRRNRGEEVSKFPKITRGEGENIAREFLKKIDTQIVNKIKLNKEDDIYNRYDLGEYSYNFIKTENGIPVSDGNIYVSVDNQSGEVRSFHSNGKKDLKFPNKEGVISPEEAKELYKENIGLELMYKLRGRDNKFETYLGYTITGINKTVDAKTKDIVSTSHQYYYPIGRNYMYEKGIEKVSTEDESKLINSKSIISRKDASKKITDTFKLDGNYEIITSQLSKIKEEDKYIWTVSVTKYEGNGSSGTTSEVDARTGEIIDFSDPGSWEENNNGKVKYSKEDLLKKAKEFIQKNNPEKYKEVEYAESNEIDLEGRNKTYDFGFVRKSNDIKVENSGFRVGISAVTGNITDYGYSWDDSELPKPENIIDKDKSKEILFDDRELELQYQSENQDEKSVKLVYDFKDKHLVVDATTGEIVDTEKEMRDKYSKKEYKDIETSFAKNQINEIQEYIVLFEGENFKPKEAITQKEFLQLLVQTKAYYYYGDNEEYLYESLINENIIKKEEKNIDGKITREEAIKYIVRAFGQEQSGSLGNIYKINFTDADQISNDLKGHIAIASGLGIISGEGNFRPKDNLRRDEAVSLIYNILNRSN